LVDFHSSFFWDDKAIVSNCVVKSAGKDSFGSVESGILKIRGSFRSAVCGLKLTEDKFPDKAKENVARSQNAAETTCYELLDIPTRDCIGVLKLDVPSEFGTYSKHDIQCFRLGTFDKESKDLHKCIKRDEFFDNTHRRSYKHGWVAAALALVPTGEAVSQYKRIGLIEPVLDNWFDDCEECNISII
jgi:hypothetical protein